MFHLQVCSLLDQAESTGWTRLWIGNCIYSCFEPGLYTSRSVPQGTPQVEKATKIYVEMFIVFYTACTNIFKQHSQLVLGVQ